jgi:hypothetical protein
LDRCNKKGVQSTLKDSSRVATTVFIVFSLDEDLPSHTWFQTYKLAHTPSNTGTKPIKDKSNHTYYCHLHFMEKKTPVCAPLISPICNKKKAQNPGRSSFLPWCNQKGFGGF